MKEFIQFTGHSPSPREARARNMEVGTNAEGIEEYCFLAFSTRLSVPQDHCLGMVPLPTLIINQEPLYSCLQANLTWRHVLN